MNTLVTVESVESRSVRCAERPITFEEWLDLAERNTITELVGGVVLVQPSWTWTQAQVFSWLATVLRMYVKHLEAGITLGPRMAVRNR